MDSENQVANVDQKGAEEKVTPISQLPGIQAALVSVQGVSLTGSQQKRWYGRLIDHRPLQALGFAIFR